MSLDQYEIMPARQLPQPIEKILLGSGMRSLKTLLGAPRVNIRAGLKETVRVFARTIDIESMHIVLENGNRESSALAQIIEQLQNQGRFAGAAKSTNR